MRRLIQIPTRTDNYAYLVVDGKRALVVDASHADPILRRLQDFPGVRLEAVINTHHHFDHVGANRDLVAGTGCDVFGPACDATRIPALTHPVEFGEIVEVAGVHLEVLDVRAHTRGHIAYRSLETFDEVIRHGHRGQPMAVPRLADRTALFVGDSLFAAGCGRLMEGTAEDLLRALQTLAAQSPESLMCCAHEYTAANLRFAIHVLPGHEAIASRQADLDKEADGSGSTVPDVLERELQTNPFLLALDPQTWSSLAPHLELRRTDARPADIVGALRAAKDRF